MDAFLLDYYFANTVERDSEKREIGIVWIQGGGYLNGE